MVPEEHVSQIVRGVSSQRSHSVVKFNIAMKFKKWESYLLPFENIPSTVANNSTILYGSFWHVLAPFHKKENEPTYFGGTNYSSPFTVTNGVRQGGVLSRYLFAVYLDELSIQLGSARVGCTVGNMVVNHLKFADDICVFSPSISGLQCLLNIYGDYAAEHEIIFNCKKTTGVLFCPKKYKQPMTKTYDKVSVSSRNLSQVSVSEVTVSTTSLFCY